VCGNVGILSIPRCQSTANPNWSGPGWVGCRRQHICLGDSILKKFQSLFRYAVFSALCVFLSIPVWCTTEKRKHVSPRPLPMDVSGDLDFGVLNLDLQFLASNYSFVLGRSQEPKVQIFRSWDQINPDRKIGINLRAPGTYEQVPGDY